MFLVQIGRERFSPEHVVRDWPPEEVDGQLVVRLVLSNGEPLRLIGRDAEVWLDFADSATRRLDAPAPLVEQGRSAVYYPGDASGESVSGS